MIELQQLPELTDPIMIAAFEGWNDAGEVATDTVDHLIRLWDAQPVARFDAERYYDMQVARPRIVRDENGAKQIVWPHTTIFLARNTPLRRDILLVRGIEPSMRWMSFTDELMTFADTAGVSLVITIGGLLADVPHTRPIPIMVTSESTQLCERFGLERSTYEGPTGIVGIVNEMADRAELETLSCWASVPAYAGASPSPKATLAMINRLEELLDILIDPDDLPEAARAWEHGVDELASGDEEITEYVQMLEQAQDTTELPEASGDAIAREFERYLRRRNEEQ